MVAEPVTARTCAVSLLKPIYQVFVTTLGGAVVATAVSLLKSNYQVITTTFDAAARRTADSIESEIDSVKFENNLADSCTVR